MISDSDRPIKAFAEWPASRARKRFAPVMTPAWSTIPTPTPRLSNHSTSRRSYRSEGELAVRFRTYSAGATEPSGRASLAADGYSDRVSSTTSGAHVLLADTDANTPGCETAIRRAGHRCTRFRDGESAAAALRVCEFDVIVTDPRIPGNENLEVLRAQREWSPRTPTIVVTGQPTLATAILALRLGAIDYLLKPIQAGAFVEVLERALSQSRTLRSLRDLRVLMQGEQQLLERLEGMLSTIEPRLHKAEHLPRARAERQASTPDLLVGLSRREIQILERFSGGDRAPTIARDLGISPHTVRNHLKAIFGKLGVRSQLELARKLSDRQHAPPRVAANTGS